MPVGCRQGRRLADSYKTAVPNSRVLPERFPHGLPRLSRVHGCVVLEVQARTRTIALCRASITEDFPLQILAIFDESYNSAEIDFGIQFRPGWCWNDQRLNNENGQAVLLDPLASPGRKSPAAEQTDSSILTISVEQLLKHFLAISVLLWKSQYSKDTHFATRRHHTLTQMASVLEIITDEQGREEKVVTSDSQTSK